MSKCAAQAPKDQQNAFKDLSKKLGFKKSFKSDDLNGPKIRKLCDNRVRFASN